MYKKFIQWQNRNKFPFEVLRFTMYITLPISVTFWFTQPLIMSNLYQDKNFKPAERYFHEVVARVPFSNRTEREVGFGVTSKKKEREFYQDMSPLKREILEEEGKDVVVKSGNWKDEFLEKGFWERQRDLVGIEEAPKEPNKYKRLEDTYQVKSRVDQYMEKDS